MAFKSFSVALGTGNTDVVTCPAGSEGAVVLLAGNVSANARTYTLKIYRQATGQTVTVLSAIPAAANSAAKVPAPISLEAGDKVIGLGSAANDIVLSGTFTYTASTPAATGFNPRGPWDSGATYQANDVVSKNFNSYLAIQSSTNQDPETQTAYWMLSAGRGANGAGDMSAANNLSDLANAATAFGNIKQAATDTATGVVELATSAEVATGSDTVRAVTPAGAAAVYSPIARSINAQTGTSYTFVIGDAGKYCTFSNASAVTVTVPPNSSVAFPVGTQIDVGARGAGQVSIAAGVGVTIRSENSMLKLYRQYSGATLVKLATDEWHLVGNLSP